MSDPLLFCLEQLAKWKKSPLSTQSLVQGIPLENGIVDVSTTLQILNKLDYMGKVETLESITSPLSGFVPFMVVLENNDTCLVLSMDQDKVRGSFSFNTDLEEMNLEDFQALLTPSTTIILIKSLNTGKHHWLWSVLKNFHPIYKKAILAGLISNILSILIPLFTMNVYDRVIPNSSFSTLWVLTLGIGVVLIVDFILRFLKTYFIDIASKNADILLSSSLLERVLGVNFDKLNLSSGTLLNYMREMEMIREFFSSATLITLIDLPFALIFLGIVFLIGGVWLALLCIFSVVCILISSFIIQKILEGYSSAAMTVGNTKYNFLIELVLGLENIKAFMAEGRMQRRWNQIIFRHAGLSKDMSFFSSAANNLMYFWQNFNYVIIVVVGVTLIIAQELSMGGLIACSILSGRILSPFSQLTSIIGRLSHVKQAYIMINELMNLPRERTEDQVYIAHPKLFGAFVFEDVNFTYPGQEMSSLKNLTLGIVPGDKIAILGRIGSGKSTLGKLLLGIHHPTSGRILIDGVDSRQIDPSDLRSNISYVPQDACLFHGTVLENILLNDQNVSKEKLEQAIMMSGVIDFVRFHPRGLGMPVGEGGKWLSGGQKQSITLARALVKDSPIIIMDEPSSMLDQVSERRLFSHLLDITVNKTFLVVSHNLKILNLVNKVLLIDQGKLLFFGLRDDFLKSFNKPTAEVPEKAL